MMTTPSVEMTVGYIDNVVKLPDILISKAKF
jgi:hypothetical protein